MSNRKIYWNSKQLAFLQANQHIGVFLGGRGVGKSSVIGGKQVLRYRELPRARTFLSSTTYNQILTKTLPSMEEKIRECGFQEGVHYVVGKRPPKHWTLPYSCPRKYENTMFFDNGFCVEFLSMDRPDLARGGNYQGGDIDECVLVPQEHITKVLYLSLRGFAHRFTSPMYRQLNFYSSVPWKPSGNWIFDYEAKAKADPKRYFWQESTSWDNVHVLTREVLESWQVEMPYYEYLIEVMNKRIIKAESAFYHRFNADQHAYAVRYAYDSGENGIVSKGIIDTHYNANLLLEVSFDFSGWFNCATVWQEGTQNKVKAEFCLAQYFVKDAEGKISELISKITNDYPNHKFKVVRVWGEPRGHDKRPDTTETIYQQITRLFRAQGWAVDIRVPNGQVQQHKARAELMNEALAETNPRMPIIRFNQDKCKDVVIAMQITNIKLDGQKDKAVERDRSYPQEHAPHFTDTVDYYYLQKHGSKATLRIGIPGTASFR